jgi:hypothetical protein
MDADSSTFTTVSYTFSGSTGIPSRQQNHVHPDRNPNESANSVKRTVGTAETINIE